MHNNQHKQALRSPEALAIQEEINRMRAERERGDRQTSPLADYVYYVIVIAAIAIVSTFILVNP